MSSGNTDNDDTNESLVARDIVVDAINTVISNISLNTAVDDNTTVDTHSPVTEGLDVLPTVLESPPPFPPLEWGDNLVAPAKDEPMVVSSSPVLDEFIPSQILDALDTDDINTEFVQQESILDKVQDAVEDAVQESVQYDQVLDQVQDAVQYDQVLDQVHDAVQDAVQYDQVLNQVHDAVQESVQESVQDAVQESVQDDQVLDQYAVQESVQYDQVLDQVQDAVQESVQYDQVLDQVHDAVQEAVQDAVQEAVQVVETTTSQLSIQEYVSLDIHKSESEVSSTNTIHTPPPSKKSWGACIYDWVKSHFFV